VRDETLYQGLTLRLAAVLEPVKSGIADVALTILRLSCAIYPPGAWQGPEVRDVLPEDTAAPPDDDAIHENWTLRSGLSSWAWRALDELKEDCK
jgi:hypothetical protein